MKLTACAGALLLLAACNSSVTYPNDPTGAMTGPIVARDLDTSFSKDEPTVHVKEAVSDECGVIFVISNDTVLFERVAGRAREIDVDELEVGAIVRVWTDVVLQSCPGQASAHQLELLSR